jgi:biopolymer transport protein ExbB
MKNIITLMCVLGMTVHAAADEPAREEVLSNLARSAEQELAASVAELNQLREQIANEKIPMAQELTTLEESLSALRRKHETITRSADAGNLEISTIKTELKARQDELAYITGLLDEYARTFDTKVHISEMQYLGQAVENAKQATENKTLTLSEKFQRQVDFVNVSVKRLVGCVGGMRFPGVGVDLNGAVVDGHFAIIGPVALFSSTAGTTSGLVIPQTGSSNPLIRPLEGKMQVGLASLASSGEGFLPLDPSRGAALKALIQEFNLVHVFEKGGPIMWPLLIASILALAVVMERLLFLFLEKLKRNPKALDRFFVAVTRGDHKEAIEISKKTKFFVVRALGYALVHREQSLANALMFAQAQELKRFRRGVSILDTVITLAPLLGLLGTVTGMMGSFSIIGGELSSPGAITGGIAEALIATAFGLGIAITALLPFNFLNTKLELARLEMESAATQLELLVQPQLETKSKATTNGHSTPERVAAPTPEDEAKRREREAQRKRAAIQRQIAQLQNELEDPDYQVEVMAGMPNEKEN